MAYWLLKSEPQTYSFADLVRDGQTAWTGVRNAQARNNLAQMQPGDELLLYHSVSVKAVVGRAHVVAPAAPDRTAPGLVGFGWDDPACADRRLVVRFTPEHAYGQLPG